MRLYRYSHDLCLYDTLYTGNFSFRGTLARLFSSNNTPLSLFFPPYLYLSIYLSLSLRHSATVINFFIFLFFPLSPFRHISFPLFRHIRYARLNFIRSLRMSDRVPYLSSSLSLRATFRSLLSEFLSAIR